MAGNETILEEALDEANADWEITRYSGIVHGFTVWDSPGYSIRADYLSWESMLTVFSRLLKVPERGGSETKAPFQGPKPSMPTSESNAVAASLFMIITSAFVPFVATMI
jgi:Dienelactone hydrolase family